MAAVGLGAALAGLAVTAKTGFDEFRESEQIMAQTRAGLKSTGGAAKVTARDITQLASRISDLSGIDDEAVQAGENMLLTFTRIRNELGKGNNIFDRATTAVADFATRMNEGAVPSSQQMAKASILIGKALNDPIKGVTALGRAGVQFTKAQREQIKAMVESGDVMGAQKLVLRELQAEFGGSAKAAGETLGGQLSKLRNWFDEVAGSVVGRVIPRLLGLKDTLADVAAFIGRIASAPNLKVALEFGGAGLRDLGTKIKTQIQGAIRGTDWGQVGRDLGQALSAALVFTDAQLSRGVASLIDAIRAHAPAFADLSAEIAVRMAANLFDPSFWIRHLDVLAVLLAARFGGGLARGLVGGAGRIVGSFLGALGGRLAAGVGPMLAAALARVPGFIRVPFELGVRLAVRAIRGIGVTLYNDLRTALERVPGWISAAFKVGALITLVGWVQTAIDKVHELLAILPFVSAPRAPVRPPAGPRGPISGKARGGFIPMTAGASRGRDSVPALLTPGEMVLNRAQQNALGGPGFLADLFGFVRPLGFQGGGVAPPPHMPRFPRQRRRIMRRAPRAGRKGQRAVRRIGRVGFPEEVDTTLPERTTASADLPAVLEESIFDADASGNTSAMISARRGAIAWLEGQLSFAGTPEERLPIKRAIKGYRDEIADLSKAPEPTEDERAQLAQTRQQLTAAQRALQLQTAGLAAGVFPPAAGGGGAQLIFQSLIPDAEGGRRAAEIMARLLGAQAFGGSSVVAPGI